MEPTGAGRRGVLIVAEAPGATEDAEGVQLVGESGQLLRRELAALGVDLDRDCRKTNAIICRPPGNRTPTSAEVDYCRPNVRATIERDRPSVILLLGGSAVRSVIGPLWREDVGPLNLWVGWKIPARSHNAWVVPTYHPAYVLRTADDYNAPAVKLWWRRHLQAAFELQGPPYLEAAPDPVTLVRKIYNPDEAAAWLRERVRFGGAVAFDYETDRLKPDDPDAAIVSCAVCWKGRETVAFPWVGAAIQATGDLLRSPVPKIGANTKFEDRWTYRTFGHWVENWVWDCVTDAHLLDNRGGITSVKFQAFVRLGLSDWSAAVKPYLESEGGDNAPNRIRELPLDKLLAYNGVDALVEYQLATLQRKEKENVEFGE